MRSQLGTRLQHCCKRLQDFCLSFQKGGITSFGEQDEISLNRFPCLASYRSCQFLQQQVLEVSTYQTRPFKATSVGQDQLQIFLPHSFWLYSASADSKGVAQRTPSQRERFGGFIGLGFVQISKLEPYRALPPSFQVQPQHLPALQIRYGGECYNAYTSKSAACSLPGVGKDTETQSSLTESAPMDEATRQ